MTQEEAFANLRNILAELYPGEASARRVVSDAGLNDDRIAFSGTAINTWHSILRETKNTGKTEALFKVVLGEYGTNPELRSACEAYRRQLISTPAVRGEKVEPQRPDDRISRTDVSSEAELSIQSPGLGEDIYIVTGAHLSKYAVQDQLVAYGEIIPGTEVAIALLRVTAVNPNSLFAQATLVHPDLKLLPGLRVDDKLEYLSSSELVPPADYAVGYLLQEGRVRLRPQSGIDVSTMLVALEPQSVGGAIVDYVETSITMRVTSIGASGAVAVVELVTKDNELAAQWPLVGTLLGQRKPESVPIPKSPVPGWFPIAGALLVFVTLGFLAFIYISSSGGSLENGRAFILILFAAVWGGGSVFFLGGWAKAEGTISVPGFPSNPITFGLSSGLAGFVIVLLLATGVFLATRSDGPPDGTPTPVPSATSMPAGSSGEGILPTPIEPPTPTATQIAPAVAAMDTSTPAPPVSLPNTPSSTSTPTQTLISTNTPTTTPPPVLTVYDDFNNPAYDGSFNEERWDPLDEHDICRVYQKEGALVFSVENDISFEEKRQCYLHPSEKNWESGDRPQLFEMKMRIPKGVLQEDQAVRTNIMMNSPGLGGSGWAACGLAADGQVVAAHFSIVAAYNTANENKKEFDHTLDFIDFDSWHTVQARWDPVEMKVSCFVDDVLVGGVTSNEFPELEGLNTSKIQRYIHTDATAGTSATTFIDDVVIIDDMQIIMWTNPPDRAVYVYVPSGEFIMGEGEDERPVDIDGFWIMQTEVTNAQYGKCVEARRQTGEGCTAPGNDRWNDSAYADHPVTRVTWGQAAAYATWVGGHLPTEPEWEKACRGTDGRIYPWGNEEPNKDLANFGANINDTMPVGSYSPQGDSPYGVADMAGNVWEWTSSKYQPDPYNPDDGREEPGDGDLRVFRGGSLGLPDLFVRCAGHLEGDPLFWHGYLGFRVLKSRPGPGDTRLNPKDGAAYVYVPAGKFVMGSSDDDIEQAQKICTEAGFTCESPGFVNEQPSHQVVLDDFWIMQTEVTNVQYARCVEAGACAAPDNDRWNDGAYAEHPVTDVDWSQASAYADWAGGRLPTEAEWEKAARGTDGRIYPWGDRAPDDTLTNYGLQVGNTTPVGTYPTGTSPYGALDMAGNVMEWVADWYDASYYANSPEINPEGPTSGIRRVVRGGGFNYRGNNVRAARRGGATPGTRDNNVGFRLVSSGF